MHELLNAGDVDRLRAWSIELFATVGFDREVIGAGRVEPPSGLESAIADGFTDALVMPPVDWQQEHRAELAAAFAGSSGWGVPYVEVGDMAPVARPEGCYVLLLHPDSRTDDDLRGLSAPALRKVGKTNKWGMTDQALADMLGVSRQRVGTLRNDGTLDARVARDLPQLEPVHVNGNGFNG